MLAQAVVCQVFCFAQPFLQALTGPADRVTPTLRLSAENLLEMSFKVHKETAYQAERQTTQAGERSRHHCKTECPQKTVARGQSRGEEAGIAVGLLPKGLLGMSALQDSSWLVNTLQFCTIASCLAAWRKRHLAGYSF